MVEDGAATVNLSAIVYECPACRPGGASGFSGRRRVLAAGAGGAGEGALPLVAREGDMRLQRPLTFP